MSTALKIILDDFANFHALQRVRRDAHGVYTLVFDKRFVLNIEADPVTNTVSLFGSAGFVQPSFDRPPDAPDFEWQNIEAESLPVACRIGIHFSTGTVMLDSEADPAQLDTVTFRGWLIAFVEQMELWSSRVGPRQRGEKLLEQIQPAGMRPGLAAAVSATVAGATITTGVNT